MINSKPHSGEPSVEMRGQKKTEEDRTEANGSVRCTFMKQIAWFLQTVRRDAALELSIRNCV